MAATNAEFHCECSGPTRRIPNADDRVEHACANKYSPATSFYDGKERFTEYRRVQVTHHITDGIAKYNWYAEYR